MHEIDHLLKQHDKFMKRLEKEKHSSARRRKNSEERWEKAYSKLRESFFSDDSERDSGLLDRIRSVMF